MSRFELVLTTRLDDFPQGLREAALRCLAEVLQHDVEGARALADRARPVLAMLPVESAATPLRDALAAGGWQSELCSVASAPPATAPTLPVPPAPPPMPIGGAMPPPPPAGTSPAAPAARAMVCALCQAPNPGDARFCSGCGSALAHPAALPPSAARSGGLFKSAADKMAGMVGLEQIQRFSLGELFSEVFKQRSPDEIEDYVLAGTRRNTPAVADIVTDWPKPWLFARVFGLALMLYALFQLGWLMFGNPNLLPGLIITGSFVVPFAALMLFYELNTPRNVSLLLLLRLALVGGIWSLLISLVLFQLGNELTTLLGASAAGIIEESGKLAAVLFATRKLSPVRYRFTLNGLLFGAAVGTGFSAFESAGYAFRILLEADAGQMSSNILMRGVLSPFGHTLWTAITAAALWRIKGARPFSSEMLADGRFLRIFAVSALCHFTWNAGFELFVPFVKQALLGFVGWAVALSLVQDGLRQVRAEQRLAGGMPPPPPSA